MRAILVCSAVALYGFVVSAAMAGEKAAEVGKPAPAFELKDLEGKTHKLADLKDKVVVLEWWNKDCPVCIRYMPKMKELAEKYGEKDVVWLGVDSTHYQDANKLREFTKKNEIKYSILTDADGKIGRSYGARTTPHMYVINKGVLVYDGAIDNKGDRNYVAEALDAVLAGKDVPLAKTKPFGCSVKYKK